MQNGFIFRWIAVAFVTATPFAQAADVADFVDFSLRDANNKVLLPGRLYVPPESTAHHQTPRPLVLFLHGSGEAGTDNANQVNGNIDPLLAEAKRRCAFLLAPQTREEEWRNKRLTSHVMAMVDRAIAEKNVDRSRIYVTGLSSGGGGVWNLLSRFPGRFAAALSISGDMPASDFVADHLVATPICAFHSRDDDTVPVAEDRCVITSILAAAHVGRPPYPAAGSKQYFLVSNPSLASDRSFAESVRQQYEMADFAIPCARLNLIYNELPVGGHGIWPAIYNSASVYDWMLGHVLPSARSPANVPANVIQSRPSLNIRLRHAFGIPSR
jgi:predicted peptidase